MNTKCWIFCLVSIQFELLIFELSALVVSDQVLPNHFSPKSHDKYRNTVHILYTPQLGILVALKKM